MAKAVLIMDMPEQVCQKCTLCYETENDDEYLCCATGKLVPDGEKPDYFCYGMRFCGKYSTRCFMIGDVLYGSAENVEVKLLDFMTEIKASEFYKAIEEEESREKEQL